MPLKHIQEVLVPLLYRLGYLGLYTLLANIGLVNFIPGGSNIIRKGVGVVAGIHYKQSPPHPIPLD